VAQENQRKSAHSGGAVAQTHGGGNPVELITQRQEWKLYRHLTLGRWTSCKLTSDTPLKGLGRRGKQNWWFAFNGQRLNKCRDALLLAHYQPEIHQWVLECLQQKPEQPDFTQIPPLWSVDGDDSAWMQ
jgi:hypothetical protein